MQKGKIPVTNKKTSLNYKNRQYRRSILKRRVLTGLSLLFCFLAGVAGYSVANSSWFNLTEVIVKGNQTLSAEELINLSELRTGINILKIPLSAVEEKIKTHPFVKMVEVRRSYPNKLIIEITERSPIALANCENRYVAVDEAGYCLEVFSVIGADRSKLIRIKTSESIMSLMPGEKSEDAGLLAALELVRQLDPFFMENIREFQALSDWDLTLITKDGLPVYFGTTERLPEKLQYYEEILIKNSAECNAKTLEYVDLRYDTQPVIKRKKTK